MSLFCYFFLPESNNNYFSFLGALMVFGGYSGEGKFVSIFFTFRRPSPKIGGVKIVTGNLEMNICKYFLFTIVKNIITVGIKCFKVKI